MSYSNTSVPIPKRSPTPLTSYNNSFNAASIPSNPSSVRRNSSFTKSGTSMSNYSEHIQNLNQSHNIDLRLVQKHLMPQEDTLKSPGGDISRHIYHQLNNANLHGSSPSTSHLLLLAGITSPSNDTVIDDSQSIHSSTAGDIIHTRKRSSSFLNFLTESRRGSTASDINVPGGFRREFLIQQLIKHQREPPNFLTNNFMEFLTLYGHFAGEDFDDEEEGESEDYYSEELSDEETPLLQRQLRGPSRKKPSTPRDRHARAPKGTASVSKTFFLLFKSLVGSGVLFLPRAFFNGGLLFSILTLSAFGFITYFCYVILVFLKNALGKNSFGELGYSTYGKGLRMFIMVLIILSQVGFVLTYVLFTLENFNDLFGISKVALCIVQCVLLIPLVLVRNLTKLSVISFISSLFIIIGLLIIFYFCGINLFDDGVAPDIIQFNSNSWTMLVGVAVTAFEGVGLVLPIESSMANPEKFPLVLGLSMMVITVIFTLVGTLGYLTFGNDVKSIIILNLPLDAFSVKLIMVLYSIAVFLTFPLQLFPAIKIGEGLLFNTPTNDTEGKLYSGKYNSNIKWSKNLFRAVSTIGICTIAYVNRNNIDKFVSFNGCFACIPLVYIYPPLIHFRVLQRKSFLTRADSILRVADLSLIVLGLAVLVYSMYQILILN